MQIVVRSVADLESVWLSVTEVKAFYNFIQNVKNSDFLNETEFIECYFVLVWSQVPMIKV